MLRRPVAAVAALVLVLEAAGIVLINLVLGLVVDDQDMSLAGLDPRAMSASAWIAGCLFGAYLLLCAAILLTMAARDRPPKSFFRIVLISCAVVQGLLGAASVGLVGWAAFFFMMLSLALIVWSLVSYGDGAGRGPRGADGTAGSGSGPGSGSGSGSGSGAGPEPMGPSPEPSAS
ncbi:hypothetical protein ACWGJ2_22285 [Streptomyces sp. NPDC054796]